MGLPEIVDFARKFAVMVRAQGPDPKGLKMRQHAFHQYHSGKTTISASGMLLPHALYDAVAIKNLCCEKDSNMELILTVASVIDPFLLQQQRGKAFQGQPELIPGAQIDIMVEGRMFTEMDSGGCDKKASHWLSAQLLKVVDVPASSLSFQSLVETSMGSSEHGWEAGWSLASYAHTRQPISDVLQTQNEHDENPVVRRSSNLSPMVNTNTRIAVLAVSSFAKELENIIVSSSNNRGDLLLAVGSPFGVLSPVHFFNSVAVGSVANSYPPRSHSRSLLMADMRCLPGMEGAPVFSETAHLVGILIRPLRQKTSSAEIQLVMPWEAIATACGDFLNEEPQNANTEIHNLSGPSPVGKAMASICLITLDDGVWASGILLNTQGLVLTNAHLLEPWRFGKNTVQSKRNEIKSGAIIFPDEEMTILKHSGLDGDQKCQTYIHKSHKTVDSSVSDEHGGLRWSCSYHTHRTIRVRWDHVNPSVWCDAKVVYICKGPLDIALLKLQHIPDQLSPIDMDLSFPSIGSKAYVIGHGLFGPRCGLLPSICSGVIAKVVQTKLSPSYQSKSKGDSQGQFPVMIETTAAVHPGSSGGAVVNSDGHMIGLITSNARHGGGTIIPHLNFSIPCAALAPILDFSRDMQDLSLLRYLDHPDEYISSVWTLMPPLLPKPEPDHPTLPQSLIEDSNKEGKGSRFAKFIAERQEILEKSSQIRKGERATNAVISSKL